MRKKTRSKLIRTNQKKAEKISLTQKIKPYLSFRHSITRFCLFFLVLLVVFSFLLSLEPIKQYFYNPIEGDVGSESNLKNS